MKTTAQTTVLIALSILLVTMPSVSQAETIRLANNRSLQVTYVDGHRYVALEDLATALDLDHEYSYDTGEYTLLTADSRNGVTVTFSPDQRKITVNKEERFMPAPPILRRGSIFLPADTLLTVLRAPRAQQDGSSTNQMTDVTFTPFLDFTRLRFVFSSAADKTTTFSADGTKLLVRFSKAQLGTPTPKVTVGTSQVASVEFKQMGSELVGEVSLRCVAKTEVFSLESGRHILIDVIDKEARRGTVTQDKKDFFSTCRVLLDAGHGGADIGCKLSPKQTEKWFTLGLAKTLNKAIKKRGFETILSRNSDVDLPLLARVNAINSASPDIVLTLHASTKPIGAPENPSVTLIVLRQEKPKVTEEPEKIDERGLYAPKPEEVRSAHKFALGLKRSLEAVPAASCSIIELPHVVPLDRLMAPSIMIDLANLVNRPKDEYYKIRSAVVDAITNAAVDYFNGLFLERAPDLTSDSLNSSETTTEAAGQPTPNPTLPSTIVTPATPKPTPRETIYSPKPGSVFDPEEFLGPEPDDVRNGGN